MASIRKKTKKGHDYYYIVTSRRAPGSKYPKEVVLEYIGPVDKLFDRVLNEYYLRTGDPKGNASGKQAEHETGGVRFKCYSHGGPMAMFRMAQYIGVEKILDEAFSSKTIQGMSRSRVLLLAAIHRAIDPASKKAFSAWAQTTSLPYHLGFAPEALSSQAFWEAMDGISEEEVHKAQQLLTKRLLEMYPDELNDLHLDYTNYFTYIDTRNGRCVVCQRGHNKQKRTDLRQFSLAMITSHLLQVPVLWEMYEGSRNDKAEFGAFMEKVQKDLPDTIGKSLDEVTVSFDGGSNSEENFKFLRVHFICAHSLDSHKELYDIDVDQYQEVKLANGHTRRAYRIDGLTFSGITGTGILTYSEDLYIGQEAQMGRDIEKFKAKFEEFRSRCQNPRSRIYSSMRKRKTEVEKQISEVTKENEELLKEQKDQAKKGRKKKPKEVPVWDEASEFLKLTRSCFTGLRTLEQFITIIPSGNMESGYDVSFQLDEAKLAVYKRKYYGKKLTCTDRTDWSTEEVLSSYASQECIEDLFKTSKKVDHFAVRPQYHWTDDKIRVHVFLCFLAITIAEVLRRRMADEGLTYTKAAMLDELCKIHDGWILMPGQKKAVRALEELTPSLQSMWNIVEKIPSPDNVKRDKKRKLRKN